VEFGTGGSERALAQKMVDETAREDDLNGLLWW